MEELLEVTKKQLRMQKLISALLAALIVILLVAGVLLVQQVNAMASSVSEAAEQLQGVVEEIDVDSINNTIYSTQEMLESVDEFSTAVDDLTSRVQEFDTWMTGIFGN